MNKLIIKNNKLNIKLSMLQLISMIHGIDIFNEFDGEIIKDIFKCMDRNQIRDMVVSDFRLIPYVEDFSIIDNSLIKKIINFHGNCSCLEFIHVFDEDLENFCLNNSQDIGPLFNNRNIDITDNLKLYQLQFYINDFNHRSQNLGLEFFITDKEDCIYEQLTCFRYIYPNTAIDQYLIDFIKFNGFGYDFDNSDHYLMKTTSKRVRK